MMKILMKSTLTLLLVLLLAGCESTPEIVPMGLDTYTVTYGGGMGWPNHVSVGPARARVMKMADKYCRSKGLVMVPIAIREQPGLMGSHTAQVGLDFRAVPPSDIENQRPHLESVLPIQRIEKTERKEIIFTTNSTPQMK